MSCPHTPEPNGIAEHKHRHIVETGLTFLSQANLPLKFLEDAFVYVVYLINRLPTKSLQYKSSLEVLHKVKPNCSTLKVFGCSCYPLLRPYNSHKLQCRWQSCIFLGYSVQHKGFKCLNETNRLYISRDVIFIEFSFLYSHKPVPLNSQNIT